jgi:hypothetical protein
MAVSVKSMKSAGTKGVKRVPTLRQGGLWQGLYRRECLRWLQRPAVST